MSPRTARNDFDMFILRFEQRAFRFWLYLFLSVGALIMLVPFYWMIITSLKPRAEILTYPPHFILYHPTLASFIDLFRLVPMRRYILNSLLGASVVTVSNLILCSMAGAFGIFLMRQFIRDIPDDLIDSARIDGCNEFYIYWRIILPLCKPALATLAIFIFMQQWNNFVCGMVIFLVILQNIPEGFYEKL